MVQFPGCRFLQLCIHCRMTGIPTGRVTPFGHPRIKGCLLLPEAFRSLPRPSSPDGSKASTVNPYSLDHIIFIPFPVPCQRATAPVSATARHVNNPSSHLRGARGGRFGPCTLAGSLRKPTRPRGPRLTPRGGMGIRTPDLWLAKPSL